VGDWQTNLARFCFAVDAGCRFALGRLHGNVPPCYRSIARDAALGQAKNRSPVNLLARFRTRPHEMFRLGGPLVVARVAGYRIASSMNCLDSTVFYVASGKRPLTFEWE
jgi:hypothetical protein